MEVKIGAMDAKVYTRVTSFLQMNCLNHRYTATFNNNAWEALKQPRAVFYVNILIEI